MTERNLAAPMETLHATPLTKQRVLSDSPPLRCKIDSWRGSTGSENSARAHFGQVPSSSPWSRIAVNTSASKIRSALSFRLSFILGSLFGTAPSLYLWVSNRRANLNLLTASVQLFTTNGLRRVPAAREFAQRSAPGILREQPRADGCAGRKPSPQAVVAPDRFVGRRHRRLVSFHGCRESTL